MHILLVEDDRQLADSLVVWYGLPTSASRPVNMPIAALRSLPPSVEYRRDPLWLDRR